MAAKEVLVLCTEGIQGRSRHTHGNVMKIGTPITGEMMSPSPSFGKGREEPATAGAEAIFATSHLANVAALSTIAVRGAAVADDCFRFFAAAILGGQYYAFRCPMLRTRQQDTIVPPPELSQGAFGTPSVASRALQKQAAKVAVCKFERGRRCWAEKRHTAFCEGRQSGCRGAIIANRGAVG